MNLSSKQYGGLCATARDEVHKSWLIYRQEKRDWLARVAADCIDDEYGDFPNCAENYHKQPWRDTIIDGVKRRIHYENEKCGFVIMPIILAAVLSWLVWRLLDFLWN